MSFVTRYRTIDAPLGEGAEAEIVVLRSRFLAQACRAESEAQARDFISGIRQRHYGARHHCTAFVIGADGALRRSNDDGEPSGTAGRPILDQISGRELSDVVVVVTRWFGGTLLGTGGLTRAYGEATSAALELAGVRERELWQEVAIRAEHAEAGALEHHLRQLGNVTNVEYAEVVRFSLAVRDLAVLDRLDYELLEPRWQDA